MPLPGASSWLHHACYDRCESTRPSTLGDRQHSSKFQTQSQGSKFSRGYRLRQELVAQRLARRTTSGIAADSWGSVPE
jgi:hypothetical protein